jgi:polyisoprenoid-binding protein YceI
MRRPLYALPLVLAWLGTGCSNGTNPTAPASAPGPSSAVKFSALPASATALAITPENTKIEFVGTKAEGKHQGGFKNFSGYLDLEQNRLEVEIDVDSIYTDTPRLTTHLKSPDFFEVKSYPMASFVSTSLAPSTEAGATHLITGDLTLHGVKKPISFPATITPQGAGADLACAFTMNRTDFGMNYGLGKVHNDVAITVSARAARP